ncbi:MAG: suppressor of fused domain protein [Acidobacteriota bacterium]
MDLAEYRQRFKEPEDSAPGWEAIDSRLKTVYGSQEPKHWGTIVKHMVGGPDPLDGISAYCCSDGGLDHLHFVTYGYSSLYYDEKVVGGEFSRFGFEMTFRWATELPPPEDPVWVLNLLQNLARYVFASGKWFEEFHWIPANGPIRAGHDTELVGLAFIRDPVLKTLSSPHGQVDFLQAFGVTQTELDAFKDRRQSVQQVIDRHREVNPLLITDLARKSG